MLGFYENIYEHSDFIKAGNLQRKTAQPSQIRATGHICAPVNLPETYSKYFPEHEMQFTEQAVELGYILFIGSFKV
jgi:hypothetical protein